MKAPRTLPFQYSGYAGCLLAALALTLILTGCDRAAATPSALAFPDPAELTPTPAFTNTPTPEVWNTFAPYSIEPATPIPPAAERMALPEDVEIWLFLGSDQEAPYRGRTDAVHLAFVNKRLSKASVISIPGSLFVYIPGYTMQRLNTAYALGGMNLVRETLAYNFGIKPDRFTVAHPQEFGWLVDDLGGVDVSVLLPIRDACGGLPAGLHTMTGQKALCYVSYLSGEDEIDRTRRQQQMLQLLFTKLVQNGRLVKLPAMYVSYIHQLDTDFSLPELLLDIPLFLRLGDPQRLSYYLLGWNELQSWELPDNTQTSVLLPDAEAVSAVFARALADVLQASPLGEIVLTYEAQLTEASAFTPTPLTPTATGALPGITGTPTPTRTLPPGVTPTPGRTRTAVPTAIFPTPYPVITPTDGGEYP